MAEAVALGQMVERLPENEEEEDDRPQRSTVEEMPDAVILRCLRAYKDEATTARGPRLRLNERNIDAFFSRQDWSHKEEGQSAEFWPKVAEAVKQFKAFVKRSMTDFGDWFSLEIQYGQEGQSLDADDLRRLILAKLNTLNYGAPHRLNFPTLISDGLHAGVLEALIILKVYGEVIEERQFTAVQELRMEDDGQIAMEESLEQREEARWHLRVDLIPFHEYLADPSGQGLYEIHSRPDVDLYRIQEMAEGDDPIYDPAVVAEITATMLPLEEAWRPERLRGQHETMVVSPRKQCHVDELWGTLLADDGRVLARNIVCTVVNDRFIVRRPMANPNWSGESPFVVGAIDRVPFSTTHQALFDDAVNLNLTINELVSLIIDGGIAEVWGTRQIRRDWLEYPEQVSNGVPQGATLEIRPEVPPGAQVLETIATGRIPTEVLSLLYLLQQEFHSAALTNDLRMGVFPAKTVKATEVVEAQQGQAGTIDGIVRDLEDTLIEPTLRKVWLTMLQHMEQMPAQEVVGALGLKAALALAQLSPARRYALFARTCTFQVHGLSATLARTREFQKLLAFFQAMRENPLLMQVAAQQFSWAKMLGRILKSLNIDPAGIEPDDAEREQQQAMAQGMMGRTAGGSVGDQVGGGIPPTIPAGPERPLL